MDELLKGAYGPYAQSHGNLELWSKIQNFSCGWAGIKKSVEFGLLINKHASCIYLRCFTYQITWIFHIYALKQITLFLYTYHNWIRFTTCWYVFPVTLSPLTDTIRSPLDNPAWWAGPSPLTCFTKMVSIGSRAEIRFLCFGPSDERGKNKMKFTF